jgi:hypothetical protein
MHRDASEQWSTVGGVQPLLLPQRAQLMDRDVSVRPAISAIWTRARLLAAPPGELRCDGFERARTAARGCSRAHESPGVTD